MGTRTVIVCMLLALSSVATGAMVSFDLSVEFSEATPPVGEAPWLNATFDDEGSSGSVVLTLTTPNLTGVECVSNWIFNLDTNLDPTALVFSSPTKTGSFNNPGINTGTNSFNAAAGVGYFDIEIIFETGGGLDARFGVGDAVEYTITTTEIGASLTADSFDFLSEFAGSHGPFPTAAHVQSIGDNEDSGWTTVPEPATLSLLAIGGVLLLIRRRKSL